MPGCDRPPRGRSGPPVRSAPVGTSRRRWTTGWSSPGRPGRWDRCRRR